MNSLFFFKNQLKIFHWSFSDYLLCVREIKLPKPMLSMPATLLAFWKAAKIWQLMKTFENW